LSLVLAKEKVTHCL